MSSVEKLAEKLKVRWPAIARAKQEAEQTREKVREILVTHRMVPADASFVVFGSLARDELNVNSDVDWTLLIDGQANPEHLKVAQRIAARLEDAKLAEPGPTRTFGTLAFSHDIIHHIGGEDDLNSNTTRRVLLLLESKAIGDDEAYKRVVANVLNRYLDDDISFLSRGGAKYKVPRFLLNDIVRYWRTMCVDYASKHRERMGQGWALRNAKLRLSRKLIFASGLLSAYSCYLEDPPALSGNLFDLSASGSMEPLLAHLQRQVARTPLEIIAEALDKYATESTARKLMDSYDAFLAMLSDGEVRSRLKVLGSRDAARDADFERIRELSATFQDSLTALFFDDHEKLAELTRKYGLF